MNNPDLPLFALLAAMFLMGGAAGAYLTAVWVKRKLDRIIYGNKTKKKHTN